MKASASKFGSRKAKEMVKTIQEHPLFSTGEEEVLGDQKSMLADIRNYKPKQATKMAFKNPFTPEIQHIIDHARLHRPKDPAEEQPKMEIEKKSEEPHHTEAKKEEDSDSGDEEIMDDAMKDIKLPGEDIKEKIKEKYKKKELKREEPLNVLMKAKRKAPESYKDPENYISLEATKSQDRLRQVFADF